MRLDNLKADAPPPPRVDFSLLQLPARPLVLKQFASLMIEQQKSIGFRVSNRGWYYILEQQGFAHNDMREKLRTWINKCRREGYLPMDFVADEASRQFFGVEQPEKRTPKEFALRRLDALLENYGVDWWNGESHYVQMIVNNVDLIGLFRPVCQMYHVPIANTRGWSSTTQRAGYARRFRDAEQRGLQPVLLYCGDLDPSGVWMSNLLRKHLADVSKCTWSDGTPGYDPSNLKIYRFGINADFVDLHKLPWVENLVSARGGDMTKRTYPYVKDYIEKYGNRKCESSCLVAKPQLGQSLCKAAIEQVIGKDAHERFVKRRQELVSQIPSSPAYKKALATLKGVLEKEMS